jgi:hypothetical protein
MGESLWIEVDEEAAILRASDSVKRLLEPAFGADLGLKADEYARKVQEMQQPLATAGR